MLIRREPSTRDGQDQSPLRLVVVGAVPQFKLGGTDTSLHLVMDSKALAKLVEVAARTQRQWQDVPAGEFANFTVTTSAGTG